MRKTLITLAALAVSFGAYAACSTHTIYGPNGQVLTCTTCCTGTYCTTNCY